MADYHVYSSDNLVDWVDHGVIVDQIEALKWIQKNIEQFGGDPNNVMIFGQSAGSGSVRTLCESPLARGLFHKAVIMSANGLSVPNPAFANMSRTPARGAFPGFPGMGAPITELGY